MVSMMMEMTGSPIMGRRKSLSKTKPNSAAAISVAKKASQKGIFSATTRVRHR